VPRPLGAWPRINGRLIGTLAIRGVSTPQYHVRQARRRFPELLPQGLRRFFAETHNLTRELLEAARRRGHSILFHIFYNGCNQIEPLVTFVPSESCLLLSKFAWQGTPTSAGVRQRQVPATT
jgi:hypothetical protein